MCGISGYLNIKNGIDVNALKKMTDIIQYRGPDDEGYVLIGKKVIQFAVGQDTIEGLTDPLITQYELDKTYYLGLGHRRLSIQDLSALGHQPMEKHDRILIFNGEIYNFLELKLELENKGYQFLSHCDTEIILSAYDLWGEGCVSHFNGMWAFAIYDKRTNNLFLSRDRFGVKPLYYYSDGENFIFSSEIKQILCHKEVRPIANSEAIAHHLRYNFREYSENTFFKNIYALPGGCNLNVQITLDYYKLGEISRYYDLNNIRVKDSFPEKSSEIIGKELRRAIKLRLRSDVKIGSCLSGGLDSSSIVGIACEELKNNNIPAKQFITVTIGYQGDKNIDETYFSNLVIQHCGCDENIITPTVDSMLENLGKIVWHQEEPLPHLGGEVSYRVFKEAAEKGCKVVFDGQGGDEGLSGYYFYYANYLWNIGKNKGILMMLKEMKEIVSSSSLTYKSAVAYLFYFNIPFVRNTITALKRNRYLSKRTIKSINYNNIATFFTPKDGLERQIEDFLYGSLPCILHWEDRNSMASSIESRLPFLDYQYVEKVLEFNIKEKIKNGFTKYPLREYVEDILPKEVAWRKNKLGFPAPTRKWLDQIPKEFVIELLDNPKCAPYFNIKKIRKAYNNKKKNLEMVEKFILVELWMRTYNVEIDNG